jgi:thymidine kinase
MDKMPKLDIIIGPMFSGKSCELIRRIRLLKVLEKQFLVLKPIIDDRYSRKQEIVSHNLDKEPCLMITKLNDSFEYITSECDTIFIDEAQFFSDLKQFVLTILEKHNINVVLVGLDGDFERKPFGQILDLIPYCDNLIKHKALCKFCNDGTEAIFTHRKTNSKEQVLVGTKVEYVSVCRKHYLEFT